MTEVEIGTIIQILREIYEWISTSHSPEPVAWWAVPFSEYSVTEGLLLTLVIGLFGWAIIKAAGRLFSW